MFFYLYTGGFTLLQNCKWVGDQIVKKSCTTPFLGGCAICLFLHGCSILSIIFCAAWLMYFVTLVWSWRCVPIYYYCFYLAPPTVIYKTNRLDPFFWSVSHYDDGQALFINNTDSRKDDPFAQGVKISQRKSWRNRSFLCWFVSKILRWIRLKSIQCCRITLWLC